MAIRVSSRDELIDYGLRQLGAPVTEINIDEEQLEDQIDMALDYYYEFHTDGLEKVFFQYTITQIDIDRKYIVLPDYIISVIKLFPIDNYLNKNIQFHAYITDIINQVNKGGLTNYVINSQYYNTINDIFNHEKSIGFNKNTNKLTIYTDWNNITDGTVCLLECFKIIDPEDFPLVYNDKWLKQYVACLFKLQYATNLRKYSGLQLVGGMTLNSDAWYAEASAEKLRLEQELRETYETPISFFVG